MLHDQELRLACTQEDVEKNSPKKLDDGLEVKFVSIVSGEHDPSEKGEEEAVKSQPKAQGCRRYLGMGLALFSSVVFSLSIVIVKSLNNYQVFSIGIWRFQGVLLPSIPIIAHALCFGKKKVNICEPIHPLFWRREKLKTFLFLFLRSLFGCGAVLLHFKALTLLNISDATVIAFSTPVFVTFMARIFLGETFGIVNVVSAIITLLGVVVVTRPNFLTGEEEMNMEMIIGAAFAFGSMLMASLTFLTLRLLRNVHYSVITFFFGTFGSIECIVFSLAIYRTIELPQGEWDWFLAIVLALLTFVGQGCITLACKYEEAGPIALCRTCDVVFSFVWQYIFFNVTPAIFSFVGSCIVMSGVLIVAFRKYLSMLPDGHENKRRFWFMLK